MSDLIYRDGVVEALTELHNNVDVWEVKVGISEAIHAINKLPSAEAVPGWIPCSERLPNVDVEVLTTTDWSDVLIAWLIKGGAWETDEYILDQDEIIAWMPLPTPYKGGDDDD